MRKIKFVLFLFCLTFISFIAFNYIITANAAVSSPASCENLIGGLVPCDRECDDPNTEWNEKASCNLCSLVLMLQLIIEFLVRLSAALALISIIFAGFLYTSSLGNEGNISKAKSMIKYTLTGFVIILIAWAVIDSILTMSGYIDPIRGKWHNVNCDLGPTHLAIDDASFDSPGSAASPMSNKTSSYKSGAASISAKNKCTPVEINGNSANKLDIVFIADQYKTNELRLFANKVAEEKNHLFAVNPFNNQRKKVNIWRVDSVVNMGCDTYYNKNDLCNISNFENIASVCPREVIVVSVNKNFRSWALGNFIVLKNSTNHEYSLVHEIGHAFGKLYDEYLVQNSSSPTNPEKFNCDVAGCPRWSGASGAICAKECMYNNWFRSVDQGIMRVSSGNNDFGALNINKLNKLFNSNYK